MSCSSLIDYTTEFEAACFDDTVQWPLVEHYCNSEAGSTS